MKFAGGVSVDKKGYLVIKAGPHRDKRVHIMVAEAMLGRPLRADEDVEHRNADKLDCHYSNLVVLGKSEHGAVSNRQKWFLKNREASERKAWEEWIWHGGEKPIGGGKDESNILDSTNSSEVSNNPDALLVSRLESGEPSESIAELVPFTDQF